MTSISGGAQFGSPRLGTRAGTWEFGGYPYGLEPLTLPVRCQSDRDAPWTGSGPADDQSEPMPDPTPGGAVDLEPHDAEGRERVFWFRWITGHQTSFICWQLLGRALADHESGVADDTALDRMRLYLRGYSLMLLYSGSCPRVSYDRIIRTPMARQHRNLTGLWARDYTAVRGLLHGRTSLGEGPRAMAVAAECRLNERIHNGIAAKLVPSGASLLQAMTPADDRTFRMSRDSLLMLYDCIFLTVRGEVRHDRVVAQFLRRLRAVVMDITANGLYPEWAPSTDEELAELYTEDVARCTDAMTESIVEIARSARTPAAGDR